MIFKLVLNIQLVPIFPKNDKNIVPNMLNKVFLYMQIRMNLESERKFKKFQNENA